MTKTLVELAETTGTSIVCLRQAQAPGDKRGLGTGPSTGSGTGDSLGKCNITPNPKCRMFHESKGNVTILKVE